MLEVASDDLYVREPHAILETFLLYETTVGIKGLSARTLRALYNARGLMNSKFRSDPVNRDTFRRILQQPEGITHAMRLMNQTSVLGRYLWIFRKIVGQMQHDLFHVYTVDQHILMVLRNVRRFFMAEHSHEYPMCSQLAAGWDKPWILYIAALFHDIAKGRGGDHSELGCKDVRVFCRQHGIAAEDAKLIEFLVGEHLSMSRIAQKEDLSDPDVIEMLAAEPEVRGRGGGSVPALEGWTPLMEALADIKDHLIAVRVAHTRSDPHSVQWSPRPVSPVAEMRDRRRQAKLTSSIERGKANYRRKKGVD
jgi:[protein-PII] uridylyltransferase